MKIKLMKLASSLSSSAAAAAAVARSRDLGDVCNQYLVVNDANAG